MFFIVNKTKKTIVLGDLSITLGPKQAIDLDKIMKRHKSDDSISLKTATSRVPVSEDNPSPVTNNRSTPEVSNKNIFLVIFLASKIIYIITALTFIYRR